MNKQEVNTKRSSILAATLRITAERGFLGASTDNIAKEAKVGVGTIYRHFGSKEQLFSTLFNELRQQLVELIMSNYSVNETPYDNFKAIVSSMINYYCDHPNEFKYLERYSDSALEIDERLDETTLLLEPVKHMLKNKQFSHKLKPLPMDVIFAMIYGPLIAVINLVHMNKLQMTKEIMDEVTQSCWDSILE